MIQVFHQTLQISLRSKEYLQVVSERLFGLVS